MNKQLAYLVLAAVFAVGGLVWIIGGLLSVYHRIFYPFIGLVNLAIAYFCWIENKKS